MLTRLNTSSEISILPTALGNHYTNVNSRLIPPGRKRAPYNQSHSISSRASIDGDPNAPEANMSMRSQTEYFGPDVLVILGVVMASGGAILTLVSFYCEFKHPAIQATMAGIGPSLVGIGMLFCVLRLFFCKVCNTRACCDCIVDGLKAMLLKCPYSDRIQNVFRTKKKIHPLLQRKGAKFRPMVQNKLPVIPARIAQERSNVVISSTTNQGSGNADEKKDLEKTKQKVVSFGQVLTTSNDHEMQTMKDNVGNYLSASKTSHLTEDLIGQCDSLEISADSSYSKSLGEKFDDEILRDEIAILDELKQDRLSSANSSKKLNETINELVLSTAKE